METIINELEIISESLFDKFGSESYELRCKLYDVSDKLKNNYLPIPQKLYKVTYKYINKTDASIHSANIYAKNPIYACNSLCEKFSFEIEWRTVEEIK